MPPAGVQLAQASQGVEVLKEGLREGRKIGAAADLIELREELPRGAVHSRAVVLVDQAVGLHVLEMSQELFAVEV